MSIALFEVRIQTVESPEAAVEMAEPAMKLTMVIESSQDPDFIPKLIPLLTEMSLAEVLKQPFVAELLPPLLDRHHKSLKLIGERSVRNAARLLQDDHCGSCRPFSRAEYRIGR